MRGRAMLAFVIVFIAFGAAQAPELGTMSDRGHSILDFEFVRTTARAQEILGDWGSKGRDAARTSLWFDYGYIVGYAGLLYLLCAGPARRALEAGRTRLATLGRVCAIAAIAAGLFDAIENAMLLRILSGHTGQPYPALASSAATLKFAAAIAATVYAIGARVALRRSTMALRQQP